MKQENESNKEPKKESDIYKKIMSSARNLSAEKHGENGKLFEDLDYDNGYNGDRARNNH